MTMSNEQTAISIVVAASENNVIGRDNDMPWRLSTDLKRFKSITLGKPIIMGRKTWQSIGRPLPGRPNIVLTQDKSFTAEGASVVFSLEEAIAKARLMADDLGVAEICIIGGGKIYEQALPYANKLHLTRVLANVDGDTFFPQIDSSEWRLISSEDVAAGEKDSHPTRYMLYERRETN